MTADGTYVKTCPLCEAMCGLRITVQDGRVEKIGANEDDVWSRGYICPKGTALGELLVNDADSVFGLRRRPDHLPPGIARIEADLAVPASLRDLPEGLDQVVYAVSPGGRTGGCCSPSTRSSGPAWPVVSPPRPPRALERRVRQPEPAGQTSGFGVKPDRSATATAPAPQAVHWAAV